MAKFRRTPYACFYLEDDYVLDLHALLRGELPAPAPKARTFALAILTGERHELQQHHLELLASVPAGRWMECEGRHSEALDDLAEKGLLLSDAAGARLQTLRERDEALSANEWNLYAALYHYMTQWSGVDIRDSGEAEFEFGDQARADAWSFVAEHGPPPGEFADRPSLPARSLAGADTDGPFYQALMERRTTRSFDPDNPMSLEHLDIVLRCVFGCHGYGTTSGGVVCIKRTSPSGGGLHPIEAYPVIRNVAGVEPGIYHYNVRDHSLVLLSSHPCDELREMATSFMCGQSYFGAAHVSFVLTARFYRNHWKYRRHQKAYTGVLMDAAHLSQTLHLVCADIGLGAFVTIAINGRDIEESLGLDGISEGVVAMAGCGQRTPGESPLELRVLPHPQPS